MKFLRFIVDHPEIMMAVLFSSLVSLFYHYNPHKKYKVLLDWTLSLGGGIIIGVLWWVLRYYTDKL